MTEKGYFFDSTANDPRDYDQQDFARFYSQIIGNGVSNSANLPDLAVTAKQNMVTSLGAGYAFANGFMYENNVAKDMQHAVADTTYDRIDRVVIQYNSDPAVREIKAIVKRGTPAANPLPPDVERAGYIYELSVAQVRIIAGKSFIEASEITDERIDGSVCGYIPLHNIYRGLEVTKEGIVSFLNQSFVSTEELSGVDFEQSVKREIPFGTILKDTQNEVISNSEIQATAAGIYHIWVEIGFDQGTYPTTTDLQIFVNVNGVQTFPLAARPLSSYYDNFVIASGFDYLKAGDVLQIKAITFTTGGEVVTANRVRVRVAKGA